MKERCAVAYRISKAVGSSPSTRVKKLSELSKYTIKIYWSSSAGMKLYQHLTCHFRMETAEGWEEGSGQHCLGPPHRARVLQNRPEHSRLMGYGRSGQSTLCSLPCAESLSRMTCPQLGKRDPSATAFLDLSGNVCINANIHFQATGSI